MKKFIVTGAYGLVGNVVRRQLEEQGHKVIALDIADVTEEGLPITRCDVRDVHRLHGIVAKAGPVAAVIHCGALSGPMLARDNPVLLWDINVTGTLNMLELCRVHGIPRFVQCASVSGYGHTPEGVSPVPETVPLEPTTVYGASKAASEALVHGYSAQHGIEGVCIRIGWVYGPRRSTDCAIRDMLEAALEGRVYRQEMGADMPRQYVHVDDIARGLIAAATVPEVRRRVFTLTDGVIRSFSEVAALVGAVVPGFRYEIGPGRVDDEDRQEAFDLSAIREDLGVVPQVALRDGIESYARWMSGRNSRAA